MAYGPWNGAAGYGHGQLRASDADRERATDVLKAAFAEGRLTKDEYDDRLGGVYGSRTYAELSSLTADLPAGPYLPAPASAGMYLPAPQSRPTNSTAIVSLILGLAGMSIPALICGYVARAQIRRTGESGDGLARAGVVLGWVGVAFLALVVLVIALVAGTHAVVHSAPG